MVDVLLVYDDPGLLGRCSTALRLAGFHVHATGCPMTALDCLDNNLPDVLVTRVDFGSGKLNGAALGRMARHRRPGMPVVFVAQPKWKRLVSDVGVMVLPDAPLSDLVKTVEQAVARGNR